MIPGYRYTAMMVTGTLHLILGCIEWILTTVGLSLSTMMLRRNGSVVYFYYVAIICSIWILLVGCIGILAGVKNLDDQLIKRLKIVYMVTTISSAALFTVIGFTMHVMAVSFEYHHLFVGIPGMLVMFLEFVLSIVSSSICCCCSKKMHAPTMSVQVPAMQPGQTMYLTEYQCQYPGMQMYGIQNQTPGIQVIPGIQNQTPGVQVISGVQNQIPCVQTCSGVQNQAAGVQTASTVKG